MSFVNLFVVLFPYPHLYFVVCHCWLSTVREFVLMVTRKPSCMSGIIVNVLTVVLNYVLQDNFPNKGRKRKEKKRGGWE